MDRGEARRALERIIESLREKYVSGEPVIKLVVAGVISQQHILIIGPPGVGKTYLARTLARLIGGSFKRIQGNPDILPSDITGFKVYVLQGEPRFIPGPIFANIVMIDEINRISTRALAALLEAMQEKTVTIDGETMTLPTPHIIIATMVPQTAGTYPLPEILLDRFGIAISIDPLDPENEALLIERLYEIVYKEPEPVTDLNELSRIYETIDASVFFHERVRRYMINIIAALRADPRVRYGPSTRASISLYHLAKVYAFMEDRDYVIPDDIKYLSRHVIEHRIFLSPDAIAEGLTPRQVLEEALSRVEVPKY